MEAGDLTRMDLDAYIALDRRSPERWEYVNGEAWIMAGGSIEHNLVCANVLVALRAALRDRACLTFPEGQKISTPATRGYHYADASVVCGPLACDAMDERAIMNPIVIVEVLSPSTEDYDRGGRFAHYRTIESLRDYLVIDPERRLVMHHRRIEPHQWLMTELSMGVVELQSIGVHLAMLDLWTHLELAGS